MQIASAALHKKYWTSNCWKLTQKPERFVKDLPFCLDYILKSYKVSYKTCCVLESSVLNTHTNGMEGMLKGQVVIPPPLCLAGMAPLFLD
jgi:hypothetical protein